MKLNLGQIRRFKHYSLLIAIHIILNSNFASADILKRFMTVSINKPIKNMSVNEFGWGNANSNINSTISKYTTNHYNCLITKMDNGMFLFQYSGLECRNLNKQGKPCFKVKKL